MQAREETACKKLQVDRNSLMCVRESLSLLELGNPFYHGDVRAIHDYQHFQNEQPEKLLNITFSSQEQVVHISLWNITSKSYKYQSKKNEGTQQQGNLLRKWCFTPPTETVTGENYYENYSPNCGLTTPNHLLNLDQNLRRAFMPGIIHFTQDLKKISSAFIITGRTMDIKIGLKRLCRGVS